MVEWEERNQISFEVKRKKTKKKETRKSKKKLVNISADKENQISDKRTSKETKMRKN